MSRHEQILRIMVDRFVLTSEWPSIRQISAALGLSSHASAHHLGRMRAEGLVAKPATTWRPTVRGARLANAPRFVSSLLRKIDG